MLYYYLYISQACIGSYLGIWMYSEIHNEPGPFWAKIICIFLAALAGIIGGPILLPFMLLHLLFMRELRIVVNGSRRRRNRRMND